LTFCIIRKNKVFNINSAFKNKDDVNEALEWLRYHKEKDFNEAAEIKKKKDAGEDYKVIEQGADKEDDD